jgi:hypothetical protein
MPSNDYVLVSRDAIGFDFAAEYRVQTTAGSTYAQCLVSTTEVNLSNPLSAYRMELSGGSGFYFNAFLGDWSIQTDLVRPITLFNWRRHSDVAAQILY